jgi:hypothetical protein
MALLLDEWITSSHMLANKLYVSIIEKAGKRVYAPMSACLPVP